MLASVPTGLPRLLPLALTAAAAATPDAEWIDRALDLDDLPAGVSTEYVEQLREHVARYEPWVRENEYTIARSRDARVVLITASERTSKRRMKLVEATLTAFDELMTPPDRSESEETFRVAEWGIGDHVPDAEPIVLIEVDGAEHYASLLERLQGEHPQLSSWARGLAGQPGFAEGRFAVGAWQSAPDGFELGKVWRPEHELVNRLARLAIHRSFGPQPTWLSVAGAWHVEMAVQDSLYCFPYRREFVGVNEHDGWKPAVRSLFKKRKRDPLRLDEFAGWTRNTWDADEAALSWAFVQYLATHHPGTLGQVAESYRGLYKSGYRTTHADGTWTTDPSYTVPLEAQERALEEACGEEVLAGATEYFRTWKKPRRRR